jgi:hypothetical protein
MFKPDKDASKVAQDSPQKKVITSSVKIHQEIELNGHFVFNSAASEIITFDWEISQQKNLSS